MHEAIREALENCLINTDYYGSRGVVITLHPNRITFANPGYSRAGKIQMMLGGVFDPRNRGLMKMFNLIAIGERAGSGIPKIFNIWKDESLKDPVIEEQFDPDRTIITLSLEKRQAIKTSDKTSDNISPRAKRTAENKRKFWITLKTMAGPVVLKLQAILALAPPEQEPYCPK